MIMMHKMSDNTNTHTQKLFNGFSQFLSALFILAIPSSVFSLIILLFLYLMRVFFIVMLFDGFWLSVRSVNNKLCVY